jgi:amino acid adenylation domain-containing protein
MKLSGVVDQKLKKLTGGSPFLLYTALLTALKVCLHKYGGSDVVAVGSPACGNGAGPRNANLLTIVADIDEHESFQQFLLRVRETLLEANKRQRYPFQSLIKDLSLESIENRFPLFDVVLALESLHQDTPDVGNDITITFVEQTDGISGHIKFRSELFDRRTIERFRDHFSNVLRAGLENTRAPIHQIEMLAEVERQQLLVEWNNTRTKYPTDKFIHQLFEDQVERTPEGVAVIFENEQLTYGELNSRANQLAHYLQALGVEPDVMVAILMERSIEMVVAVLGILKAGGAYLPLDPEYPQERLSFILADTRAPVLLTRQRSMGLVSEHVAQVVCLDTAWEAIAREGAQNPATKLSADNLAYVIYTSGSTGKPKGVMIPHRGILNYLDWCTKAYAVGEGRGAAVHSPLSFDLTITSLFSPLIVGRSILLVSEGQEIEGLGTALRTAGDFSLIKITPSHLDVLCQLLPAEWGAGRARALIIGGEALSHESLAFWHAHAPETRIINEYGPTETVVGCCVYEVPVGGQSLIGSVPIGRPIANMQLYVLDRNRRPVPVGVIGELYIGGDGLARGYLNRPGLTAEKFIPNPFSGEVGTRLYRTGDLARYLADGNLEFMGRNDEQVKVRGYRIELGEIEAIVEEHPQVRDAVVVVREDTPGDKRLVAYIVADQAPALEANHLLSLIKEKLPEYMVPQALVFMDELPLTSNGKVDRGALPLPERDRLAMERNFVAPRTTIEDMLAGIWADVLKVERVGIYNNFFELGGHSLLATQVISRIRHLFQVDVSLRALFESPTVAGLAASVEGAQRAALGVEVPPLRAASRAGELPLSFAQQRLWFLDQLEPGGAAYNVAAGVRVRGEAFRVAVLEQALGEIVRRHEALRTSFPAPTGEPRQHIAAAVRFELPVVELGGVAGAAEQVVRRLAREEAERPFDLGLGPLMQVRLLRLGAKEHVVLLTLHHIISDGWSMGVLVREIAALYEAFNTGQPSPLPELEVQYADYAVWQREWLKDEVVEKQLEYWVEQLGGELPVLDLPATRPPNSAPGYRAQTVTAQLSEALSGALKHLSQQEGTTLFTTMLAAFFTLLHRYSGQDDIIIGSPVAHRPRIETEPLIGCLINTVALRVNLGGNPSFRQLLRQVREVVLGAQAHQDVPYQGVVDAVRRHQRGARALFEVWFHQQERAEEREVGGLEMVVEEVEGDEAGQFRLVVGVEDREEGLRVRMKYNAEELGREVMEQMVRHYEGVLERVVEDVESRVLEAGEAGGVGDDGAVAGGERGTASTDADRLEQFAL